MTAPLALEQAALPSDAIEIGRISDAWGVKGWFKVLPYSSDAGALLGAKRWYLQPTERGARSFEGTVVLDLRQTREHSGAVVAWAQGIDDRNAAEALRGSRIFVPRSGFPKAGDGEYYWVDLIGLAVQNREGVALGTVRELLTTGPQTVLVLDGEVVEGKLMERMIPFVAAFVDEVDLAGRRILVDWQPDY
ncbi:ribosome maturation factor RimM [Simplicispira suum]|uniref:Ribosome maturation factor RimM n=1 Tax=Simplicispira suum TaxID=2109915 RepID=A0A2S0MWZ9_9BURK|nr:ribosome maturation factor RimM [Simplicispira suum]AVO40419.1 ribosome maturation factor RimM [Simplicispira suum]